MITKIEETYKNLEVIDVLKGNSNVYQRFFMDMDQNKALKKKTLSTSVRSLVEAEGDPYVDLTITMKRKEPLEQDKKKEEEKEKEESKEKAEEKEEKSEILPYVPPVRVWF